MKYECGAAACMHAVCVTCWVYLFITAKFRIVVGVHH